MDSNIVCIVGLATLVGMLIMLLADVRARERAWREIAAQRRYDHETAAGPARRRG